MCPFHVKKHTLIEPEEEEVWVNLLFIHAPLPLGKKKATFHACFPIVWPLDQSLLGAQRPHKEQERELGLRRGF